MVNGSYMGNIEEICLQSSATYPFLHRSLGLNVQTPTERPYRLETVDFKTNNPRGLVEKLDRKEIVVSARAIGITVLPQFYSTEEGIDKLVSEIQRMGSMTA